jgi:hypothetical protein
MPRHSAKKLVAALGWGVLGRFQPGRVDSCRIRLTPFGIDLHKVMTIAEEYAERIAAQLGLLKSGTLRIWGEWFGRPYDNIHRIVGARANGTILTLSFDEGETLTIYDPDRGTFDENVFCIELATRVRWEWYLYGKDHSADNLHFLDYLLGREGWTLQTNWHSSRPPNRMPTGAAVELV